MLTKPIAVAGLAAAVIMAAGAGAYLAVRQNAAPPQLTETSSAYLQAAGLEGAAVEATEALVGELVEEPVEAPLELTDEVVEGPVEPLADEPDETPVEEPAALVGEAEAPAAEPAEAEAATRTREAPSVAAPAPAEAPLTAPAPPASVEPAGPLVDDAPPVSTDSRATDLPVIDGWGRPDGAARQTTGLEPLEARPTVTGADPINDRREPEPMLSFEEFEIAADSVIGLQVETAVSTRTAEVEDPVEARVTRDVLVADQVAVSAGTRVLGSVVLVEQGGKLRDASRLGVRFHTLVMADDLRVPIVTETIYREGTPQGRDSVAKIGGAAVGGAILGAIFGGGRGAAIGGSIGAAGGTAAALKGEAEPAGLPPGTMLTVRLSHPVLVTVEQ